ncbi:MAG: bifunctional riboflavin kinase/FAD synthetase [Clostridia bacterium]|nr:bifunctional riboflavin kinase/FAD synthetase [Clostridia bacterium]
MKILHSLPEVPFLEPTVIALGNFDGVHRGHQVLIARTVEKAKGLGGKSVVMTFNPHPLKLLKPEESPGLLITQERKEAKIAQLGADLLLLLPFTYDFAALTPDEFVRRVYATLNPAAIVVGFNYTYGSQGRGDTRTLAAAGEKLGFAVEVIPPQREGKELISSTKIRQALAEGNVGKAKKFLGYWPLLEGTVVAGDRRGRKLGFPTANVQISQEIMLPRLGVYAAKCLVDNVSYSAVVNIGFKPTFAEEKIPVVEAHLLDFRGDLYDCRLEVHLLQYLRPEKKFPQVEKLMEQIRKDILIARSLGSM